MAYYYAIIFSGLDCVNVETYVGQGSYFRKKGDEKDCISGIRREGARQEIARSVFLLFCLHIPFLLLRLCMFTPVFLLQSCFIGRYYVHACCILMPSAKIMHSMRGKFSDIQIDLSLAGRIEVPNTDNFTHALYMRFQKREDLAKFYKNSYYSKILREHVTPFSYVCHSTCNHLSSSYSLLLSFKFLEVYCY